MTRWFNSVVVFFIASLLLGCGFHLKGQSSIPSELQTLELKLSTDPDFNNELITQLKKSSVKIITNDQLQTAAFLSVKLQQSPEVIVAQSSSTDLQVVRLKIQLEYSLKNAQGEWLALQQSISQTRDFEADTSQILGKDSEKRQLYLQMKQSLVRILLYKMQLAR